MVSESRPATIALTPGEPAGIGPDLVIAVASRPWSAALVVHADLAMMQERARLLRSDVGLIALAADEPPPLHRPGWLTVVDQPLVAPVEAGRLDSANVPPLLAALDCAIDSTLDGRADVLVTGPLHKGVINSAGYPFTGHTEYIAARSGGEPVMMLAAPGLRVALATTHLPLAEVASALNRQRIDRVLRILLDDLQRHFSIEDPCVAVCGINPHAGEDGYLGREEVEWLTPLLDEWRARGARVEGPLPADTLFTPPQLAGVDAVLAMYHDQGLPVLKHLGFGRGVNITLGLPLLRISVDHGTALSLAAGGSANSGSLEAALSMAIAAAQRRREVEHGKSAICA